jgi:hypothetical protein
VSAVEITGIVLIAAGTMISPMRSPVSLISFSVSGAGYRQPICIQPTSRPTAGRMTRPPRSGLAQVHVGASAGSCDRVVMAYFTRQLWPVPE